MIDLVCQDAALEACHSWIYLIDIINWLTLFRLLWGKRIQPTPRKNSELKQYLKF